MVESPTLAPRQGCLENNLSLEMLRKVIHYGFHGLLTLRSWTGIAGATLAIAKNLNFEKKEYPTVAARVFDILHRSTDHNS